MWLKQLGHPSRPRRVISQLAAAIWLLLLAVPSAPADERPPAQRSPTPRLALLLWKGHLGEVPYLLKAPFDAASARQAQEAWAKHLKREVVETNSIGMKLALIPPGEFMLGSPESEVRDSGRHDPKETQHCVRITRRYDLGVLTVRIRDFRQFVDADHYKSEAERNGLGGWGHVNDNAFQIRQHPS